MENNNNHYVYFHINLVSNEVFYVGKGKSRRAWSKWDRNKHWKNIVSKYGYRVYIVKDGLTDEEAKIREIYYIKEIGRKDLGLGSLVNFTDGGEGSSGAIRSNETRKKMSNSHKGKKSKPFSEETKQKMSEAKKGKPPHNKGIKGIIKLSEETKAKMSDTHKKRQLNKKDD